MSKPPGELTDRKAWVRAWRAGYKAIRTRPERHADAWCTAVRGAIAPALRTDAAPRPPSFLRLPPPPAFPSFARRLPHTESPIIMSKKNKDSAPESPFASESELMARNTRRNDLAYTGASTKQLDKWAKQSRKAIKKDREAARADAARRADAAPRLATPVYSARRVDAAPSEEARAAERLRRHSESAWQTSGNADALRGSGS